ncbi:MAG TPA: leucyl/phenylalanyl-tRNA--protein transferase [Pyrinomonadaceae bacterium]|nr:leucyl/phenylalanyl-tRNA--protein transferase [Pyrinomonadaceae bacterium]
MPNDVFPDPRTYDFPEWVRIGEYYYRSEDVVDYGTPLTVDNVREAYLKGIFPWYMNGIPLPWHCPERRAILEFADLRVPRSLAKASRQNNFAFTIDADFRSVIASCARAKRPDQPGTWITSDFERVYSQLHDESMAHSVEAWNRDGQLVGGLYGIDAGGVFCGESMFYHEPNASKLALLHLIDHLTSRGSTWLDCQVMTPHMEMLGAKEIYRNEFLEHLSVAQERDLFLFRNN